MTHIIHTAWELNFNWKLEHFERFHIAGVRHLVDLAMSSRMPQSPRFIFMSSIGAVANAPSPILEISFGDPSVTGDQGYGEAKFVAERIIDKACASGLRGTIIRAGQLSGSTTDGYWTPSEYMPSLFRVSKMLGCLPSGLPVSPQRRFMNSLTRVCLGYSLDPPRHRGKMCYKAVGPARQPSISILPH